ncbi:MAG: CRISPR-associated helicase Cas3' [Deltaproteobacteria bacterium]|nr:CRISPR-associated helicase Cas3' [Deltaproteobacteria bacterium]
MRSAPYRVDRMAQVDRASWRAKKMTSARAEEERVHVHLWGKADPKRAELGPSWHPLVAHMLDVAACAERLLRDVRSSRLDSMARALGLSPTDALPWLSLFVTLHDLGKATPAFQRKVASAQQRLETLGFDFPDSDAPHGEMSAVLLPAALESLGVGPPLGALVARAVGAHHGAFGTATALLELDARKHRGKRPQWETARDQLVRDVAAVLGVGPPPVSARGSTSGSLSPNPLHAFVVDLAGLTTAADWLGSNADVFGYVEGSPDLGAYLEHARGLAARALDDAGFRRPPRPAARTFQQLFGDDKSPWPLHRAVTELLPELSEGSLVVVEAPMGEGKTEAALMTYDALASRGADGLYFALPTQATANQILGRVEAYLGRSFAEAHGLHLVHGGAALSDRYGELKRRAFRARSVDGAAGGDGEPIADAWFARSKRALLAPLGVGTVDQSLLGVLRAKHHFLRLHGLAGKVIVVDEVHAYDTYTSEVLARLCEWLRSLGATVLLLSATLSSPQRARLLAAYGVTTPPAAGSYPRITVAEGGQARVLPFASRRASFDVALAWRFRDVILAELAALLRDGGCVAWIVNTVGRAQSLYANASALRAEGVLPADLDLRLIHARLPFSERQTRERAAETAFGPPGASTKRPRTALLIGTQVLEQSLDLDFDLMVTELAPVDLVLQRAGRLHRHDGRPRPPALATRTLWIETPGEGRGEGPAPADFGPSAWVYDEAVLLASYEVLRQRASVQLPTDIEPLVEAVYAEGAMQSMASRLGGALGDRLAEKLAELERSSAGDRYRAELKLLPSPDDDDPFGDFSCFFDEEDPKVHETLRAVTRLGDPSVTVVPVVADGSRLSVACAPGVVFDPMDPELPFATAATIARSAISVGRRGLVGAILADPSVYPRAFERSPVLRHHRVLRLDDAGFANVGGTAVRLDPVLGLLLGRLASTL